MNDLKKICQLVEAKKCMVHHQNASATIEGAEIVLNNLCCNEFRDELHEFIGDKLMDQTKDGIDIKF
jgi:hypothetical protein